MTMRAGRVVDLAILARTLVALVLLAWLPGHLWVRVLAPQLDGAARFVLGVALSIALLTLLLYGGNVLLGIPVGGPSAVAYAALLCALAAAPWLFRLARDRAAVR